MTLFPLIMFSAGKSRGSGNLGRGGPFALGEGCDASYDGGGSNGVFWSAILV